jgi:drug/metabolite transporter (DMT)-like permease
MNALLPQALLVAMLWGSASLVQKSILTSISAEALWVATTLMHATFVPFVWLAFGKRVGGSLRVITPKQWGMIAIFSTFGMVVPYLLYLHLLKKYDSHIVVALTFTSPIFVLLGAALVLKERVSIYSVAGVCLVVAGVVLLNMHTQT